MGTAQLLIKVSTPTAMMLKSLMPLYALDRSTEEIALEPPEAKKDAYWSKMDVVEISATVRSEPERHWKMTVEKNKSGTFVARDCVMARRVYA